MAEMAEAATINVPDDYTTIQAAINAATDGDTINVADGTYAEGLSISQNNITINGVSRDGVIINAGGYNNGIKITGDNVEIGYLTVENASAYNIHVSHNTGCSIHDVTAIGQGQSIGESGGIDLNNANNATVSNVLSKDNSKNGISVLASSDVRLSNFTVQNNGASEGWAGVAIYTYTTGDSGDSSVSISGTNTISGNPMGIYLEDYPTYTITPSVTGTTTFSGNLAPLLSAGGGTVINLDQFAEDLGLWVRLTGSEPVAPNGKAYFKTTTDAYTAASGSNSPTTSVIFDLENNSYFVGNGMNIQLAIDDPSGGDTINVAAGTYNEGIIIINKDLTIIGASTPSKPIINPTTDTGFDNVIGTTGRGWFQITEATVDFENLVFDGTGKNIRTAVHYHENSTGGTVENCDFINIAHESLYHGRGINNYGQHVEVLSCTFSNIQRIGVFTYNTTATTLIDDCTYVGKGDGDWLDYGIEFSGGGSGTVEKCDISACTGVAVVGDSKSAGVLATDYYGTGTVATVENSTFTGNTHGIYVGYNSTDATVLTAHFNNFSGNTYGIANGGAVEVDATNNWWGDASGPYHITTNLAGTGNAVSDNVNFVPFLASSGGEVVNNVSITKGGPTSANSGVDITYTITYKNIGTNYATNVVIIETYPSEVKYVSANPAPDIGNNQWTIGTLAPGAEDTITVTVHIK